MDSALFVFVGMHGNMYAGLQHTCEVHNGSCLDAVNVACVVCMQYAYRLYKDGICYLGTRTLF